jgi:hypothetical protein
MFIPAPNEKQELDNGVRKEKALIKAMVHICLIHITSDLCCNKSTVCIPSTWYMQFQFVCDLHMQQL